MSKHTPGPWAINYPRSKTPLIVQAQTGQAIAIVSDQVVVEKYPNAVLIAAAPRMLHLLAELGGVLRTLDASDDPLAEAKEWSDSIMALLARIDGEQ